jgi:DNA repair exonuclease SbcCD ATPase subunit
MIKLKTLTIRNFLSVGNTTQAVNIESPQLTLVLGENLDLGGNDSGSKNGVGKSSVLSAISYALYGQALNNIRKDNLINRTNAKNMMVTLDFEVRGQNYRVERGRKPAVMRFFVGDQEKVIDDQSQGDSRETQQEIDRLLGMSHDMFRHIVALNTYTEPFLALRANDQRTIIEQLLGITMLSEKAERLKELNRNVREMLTQEQFRLKTQDEFNQRVKDQIASLRLKQSAWHQKKTADLEKLLTRIQQLDQLNIEQEIQQHQKLAEWMGYQSQLKTLKDSQQALVRTVKRETQQLTALVEQIATLDQHRCPECDQELHKTTHQQLTQQKTQQKQALEAQLLQSQQQLDSVNDQLDKLPTPGPQPSTHYNTLQDAYQHQTQLNNLINQYDLRQAEVDSYQDQIVELSDTVLQELDYTAINELQRLLDHQEFLLKILTNKDSFVRKQIIDQNLGYLNQRLASYLDRLGLPHQVRFLNDLTVDITELGRELDFYNLSRGEMNRVILGLSFAFRDVWENLYQPINLYFIDELLDNGTDAAGVENALSILKDKARNRAKSVWLISHRDELVNRVNSVFKVVKENGFTRFDQDQMI